MLLLLSSSLKIDECGPSSNALTGYSTSDMLLSTELDACMFMNIFAYLLFQNIICVNIKTSHIM